MNYFENAKKHFKTITRHRHEVIKNCFRAGIGLQGLFHDLSKYSPAEFIPGMLFYQGDRSPNESERETYGYSKERNILQVYLNKDDALMCGNDYIGVDQLREKAKEFIANVANAEHMPEKTQKNVEFFGTYLVNDKHVISLQNDRGSSYQAYISLQNELVAAYNELRDELAEQKFGTTYAELNDDQQKAIREIYPQRISEAEPKKYGEKKK